uniref:Uncharacterized protein n=1 Tax=Nelumbo nucifera TaxID=4432 RepID=A0A822Y458_NELNU|nr:TPA_asm: hypothetical protein HUJ06_028530 [Nelumbo nucifera]
MISSEERSSENGWNILRSGIFRIIVQLQLEEILPICGKRPVP